MEKNVKTSFQSFCHNFRFFCLCSDKIHLKTSFSLFYSLSLSLSVHLSLSLSLSHTHTHTHIIPSLEHIHAH